MSVQLNLFYLLISLCLFPCLLSAADVGGATTGVLEVYQGVKAVMNNVTVSGEILEDANCMKPISYKDYIVRLELENNADSKAEGTSAAIDVTKKKFSSIRKLVNGSFKATLFNQRKNLVVDEKKVEVSGTKLKLMFSAGCK